MGWSIPNIALTGLRAAVSIPERVWGGLELKLCKGLTRDILFQSLRGFGVGWSQIVLLTGLAGRTTEFQSLRGFGVGWSAKFQRLNSRQVPVSIPERVWGGLELLAGVRWFWLVLVSIPERVWGGLEPALPLLQGVLIYEFQSLRGFGVGWSLTT